MFGSIRVHSDYNESKQELTLKGIIVSPDGTVSIEDEVITCDEDCEQVGIELGDKSKGAKEILDKIDMTRNINARPTEV